jgi:hypothetical protein
LNALQLRVELRGDTHCGRVVVDHRAEETVDRRIARNGGIAESDAAACCRTLQAALFGQLVAQDATIAGPVLVTAADGK